MDEREVVNFGDGRLVRLLVSCRNITWPVRSIAGTAPFSSPSRCLFLRVVDSVGRLMCVYTRICLL